MSSLCRGDAHLLCVVPMLIYVLPKRAPITLFYVNSQVVKKHFDVGSSGFIFKAPTWLLPLQQAGWMYSLRSFAIVGRKSGQMLCKEKMLMNTDSLLWLTVALTLAHREAILVSDDRWRTSPKDHHHNLTVGREPYHFILSF